MADEKPVNETDDAWPYQPMETATSHREFIECRQYRMPIQISLGNLSPLVSTVLPLTCTSERIWGSTRAMNVRWTLSNSILKLASTGTWTYIETLWNFISTVMRLGSIWKDILGGHVYFAAIAKWISELFDQFVSSNSGSCPLCNRKVVGELLNQILFFKIK